jgi:phytoene synthase
VRESEILRDLRQDAYGGRVYLPQDLLAAHNVTLEDLRDREVAPRLKTALREYRPAVQEDLQSALAGVPKQLRPLGVLAGLHRRLLDRIAANDYNVAAARIDLGPIEKPWVAWRTARKL